MKLRQIIFLILFVLSFILSAVFNYDRINVPYFGGIYKSVWVDVIYKENEDLKLVRIENNSLNTLKIDENHYLYKIKTLKKVDKVNILNPDKIRQVIVFVDKKAQFDNFNQIDNSKNFLDKFVILTLSFFYNFYLYLFSYIFLFLFLYNFKARINCFWLILIFCFILRLAQLNSIPFWDDEIYVLKVTAPYSPLSELFSDPGNPPLYFMLFKIFRIIFQNPLFYRLSSVLTGFIFCIVFYLYIKKMLNEKMALTGLFFAGFNIALIYLSQEIRCYMLLALLAILTSYFLFKKKKIAYLITSVALLYTHFYGTFYYLYNFLFSIFYFKRRIRKDFIILNIISGLTFLPFAIYRFFNLDPAFNSWIKMPVIEDYIYVIKTFSGYVIIFLIFIAMVIYSYFKSGKRKKLFILYNFGAIIGVTVFAVIFSYFVKPIFIYRYFYIVYPCYIALCAILTSNIRLNIIIFLLFISQGLLGYQNLYCNHNLYLDFINHNIDKKKNNYVIMTNTVEGYKEFLSEGIKPIYIRINTGINTINPLQYINERPSVCWILNLYLDEKTYSEAKNIELYKTPLGVFARVEY